MANEIPPASGVSASANAPIAEPRTVDAGRGASWWSEAWRLFTPAAGTWLLIVVILFLLNIVFSFIPLIGHLAGQILFPAIIAGIMLGCRAIDRGEAMSVSHLFAGFGERGGPLLILGLIYTALVVAIFAAVFGLLFVMFGAAVLSQLWSLHDPLAITSALGTMLLALLVGVLVFLLLYLPLIMAIWFAPALVVFRNIEPWTAMKMSFSGSLKNVLPFFVYSLVGLVLAIAASVPLMLGWLILVPVSLASIYTGYCDIYEDSVIHRAGAAG